MHALARITGLSEFPGAFRLSSPAANSHSQGLPWLPVVDADFQNRVAFTVQTHAAKPICQITLFLVVDRDTDAADSGGALLAVDSLDIQMATPGKAKYQR